MKSSLLKAVINHQLKLKCNTYLYSPPIAKLEFFSNVEKLLWISEYHLYHVHATIIIKDLAIKSLKLLNSSKIKGNELKFKELTQKLEKYDIQSCNDRIVLSALSTPLKDSYTNYLKVGDELYDFDRNTETETCSRMMGLLKLSHVPSRKLVMSHIESNKILESCSDKVRELYNLIEKEKNPLTIANKGLEILKNDNLSIYDDLIKKNLILKCLNQMSNLYDSISFVRLGKIFSFADRQQIEEIIFENTRIGIIHCKIDHSKNIVKFRNQDHLKISLNDKIKQFQKTIENITGEILENENKKKTNIIRNAIINELQHHNENGLTIYDNLVNLMKRKIDDLKEYKKLKEEKIIEERSKKEEDLKLKKEQAELEIKKQKELLKDEQKSKELDMQLKKYLIERIKVFTNSIVVDGKKIKLDEIQKDLDKIKSEVLIKVLEDEEINFKTKKEKKFKQLSKETDYIIREFRRRDMELYLKKLTEEEKEYNRIREETNKKLYTEKIGMKDSLLLAKLFKEDYFEKLMEHRKETYDNSMKEFTVKLEKVVIDDFEKEVHAAFKVYYEDFKKRREEEAKRDIFKNNQPRNNQQFVKGGNVRQVLDTKPQITVTEFVSKYFLIFRGKESTNR
jgi:translation initiation factor 3 subunit A